MAMTEGCQSLPGPPIKERPHGHHIPKLAGQLVAWSDAVKEWNMIESQLVLEWTAEARREAELQGKREYLLLLLKCRFPDGLPEEIVSLINRQESFEVLRDWFQAAANAASLEEFLAVLRR
jgi:hypothetical protein